MLDWEETDRFSFEDSDRFEEDSLCSWSSEPESLCNNWRGWKRPTLGSATFGTSKRSSDGSGVPSLGELTARCVAAHIPFELVEHVFPPVPEQLQLQIAFWSFPDNEEDIRLYSCLANGSADEFQRGEHLFKNKTVKEPLQIGFHLSASVCPPPSVGQSRGLYNVAVTFDRRRITSCNCTCMSPAYWCSHVVAVCLHRIHLPTQVCLRAPVSESLSRLHREQLQKFAQYLISELPQQILPTAQRLLDELLSPQSTAINSVCGAPDPTAGASANDQTSWYLDEKTLHDNIKKILIKFCVPAPIVFSDVNYLSTTAPPAAAEWSSLLRPLRGREPEGMWNLLSIVREMFKRNDRNAIPLLEIITQECMACEQILVWWVNTKVALLNGGGHGAGKHSSVNSNSHASQHACSSLCDEIVVLWRLAALNPGLSPEERSQLQQLFTAWHIKIVDKVTKSRGVSVNPAIPANAKNTISFRHDVEVFTGFKPALEACYLDWEDYTIPGITYTPGSSRLYHCPFTCFRHSGDSKPEVNQVNSSQAVLNRETVTSAHHHTRHCPTGLTKRPARISGLVEFSYHDRRLLNRHDFPSLCTVPLGARERDGNRSSVSSEGFCENETDAPDADLMIAERLMNRPMRDSDSQEGGGSDSASSSGTSTRDRVKDKRTKKHETRHKSPMSSVMYEIGSFSDFVNPHSLPGPSKCYQLDTPGPSLPGSSKGVTKTKSEDAESDISTPESRQPSKDESSSTNSDSQQSGDEYNVYYYDPKERVTHAQDKSKLSKKESGLSPNLFANLKKMEDPWDILFARAEGLHAHGHGKEACSLGVQLAEQLLANPPDLMVEIPVPSALAATKGRRKKLLSSACLQVSCLASATLAKCGFLCTLLAESLQHFNLAFRVGLFGLELARPPASTKPLEVKLANQECELVNLLKRIPLGSWEIGIIRDRAHQLKAGTLRSRGEALLPIMLASFLFDALLMPAATRDTHNRCQLMSPALRLPTDEELGFEAAVAALGLKANVSEADHPLLCEGTRRQRGDLAITLLVHYKDDANKVARIMDKLLDREVHQLIKTPILGSYYCHPASKHSLAVRKKEETSKQQQAGNLPVFPVGSGGPSGGAGGGSGDHDQAMTLNTQQSSIPQVSRNKDARFKGKRVFPSIPNQPSEAGAHFMFELAKTVLTKAGGNSSTSLFTQASTNQNHHGPHRALHICAFQIGLYALGLHNCVSPNWLSRTYSSHVSWITGQAMEIGAPAISFLIDTWEGHLTPPEAVSIADRASRGCDPNIVRAAAELALSCLPHSHALNPNEIQRAILQCKEQSDLMLEHSCLTVENAAKGGGVYPEVLFQVARYWYELYVRHTPGGEQPMDDGSHDATPMDPNASLIALVETNASMDLPPPPSTVVVTTAPPHYQTHPYTVPYSFAVQGVGVGVHPHLPFTPRVSLPPPHLQMFLSPPTFQYPPHTANQAYVNLSTNQNSGNQTYVNLSANQNPGNQTYVNLSANQNAANQTFVNLSTSQGASNQAFVNLSSSQSSATPTFVNLTNQNVGNQAFVNLSTNQGGSNPTYVNLSTNQGSAAPAYVNLSTNQGSATPTYVNLSANQQGSPAPTYVNLSGNQNPGNQGYVNQGSIAPMQYYGAVTIAPSRAATVVAAGNHHVYPIATMQPGPPIQGQLTVISTAAPQSQPQPGLPPIGTPARQPPAQVHRQPQPFSQAQLRYLLAAYRVGMLALETLARRVHDDRPQAKYARNPPYGEDVKWLLRVSKKLGSQYLHQFCVCAVNSIVSPFVLHDVALEAAHYLSRNNPGLIMQHLRSALTPLVQKCQQMYIQCMHQKLYHLTTSDYEDFVNIVMSARAAFHITPEGNTQFKEWLQSIRRSKSCKKDLWTQINAALQANSK